MTIVIPAAASSRMTSSTSATSSGSRALVISSSSSRSGLHRERPDDRDALLLAAGQAVGVLVALVGEAEPLEQRRRVASRPRRARALEDLAWRERHVVEHASCAGTG